MVCSILHATCLSILLLPSTCAKLFSAKAQIKPLLETQARVIDDLDGYITKEGVRLAVLKSYFKIYKQENKNAKEHIQNYIGNPINAFNLIKRLTTDLNGIKDYIKLGKENIERVTLKHTDMKYPSLDDLSEAAQAVLRLQTTGLHVRDLVEGRIKGFKQGNPLTATDCFGFSYGLYRMRAYEETIAWSMEALRKYKEKPSQSFKETDILKLISVSHYYMGDATTALEWIRKLLELDPDHAQARRHAVIFEEAVAKTQINELEPLEDAEDTKDDKAVMASYEALCRGEKVIPTIIAKRLHCRYMTETHPFLRLAPFKVEQLYIDPDVFLFHNVISDSEIESIKENTTPRLERAMVYHHISGKPVTSEHRVSMSAWLPDKKSPAAARVTRRVTDMTGLSVMTAEYLQVVKYNIGGLYRPHSDFVSKRQKYAYAKKAGNRIATVLFYMSDVEQGGETVFTELGLSVVPLKGAALFWLNLLPSGEGDFNTIHASCPVLRGSKWVGVKWFRQGKVDQEDYFTR